MQKNQDVCGCGGPGVQRGLGHLIDMLERQREREKPVNQAEVETGEWPVVKPKEGGEAAGRA